MSLEDFFAHKSNYEMGKEFASWHCPALNVLRVSDLRLLKNLLLFFQTYVFYHWLVRKKSLAFLVRDQQYVRQNAGPDFWGAPLPVQGPLSSITPPASGDRDIGSIWGLLCVIYKSPLGDSALSPSWSRAGVLNESFPPRSPESQLPVPGAT